LNKKVLIFGVIIVLLVLLIPIPHRLKDGGTVVYKSIIYKVLKVHRLDENSETGYRDGLIVEILGFKVYNNVK